jgi:hypothetical protein
LCRGVVARGISQTANSCGPFRLQTAVLCWEARFSGATRAQSRLMKALKRIHAARGAVDRPGVVTPRVATPGVATQADEYERVRRLDSENAKLRELVQHCAVHSAYGNCGYEQMNAEQKSLFNAVVGRRAPASALRIAGGVPSDAGWRSCEFCGCRTNATERVCCRRGSDTDRRNWNPPGT